MSTPDSSIGRDPYAPFRPRSGRWVPLVAGLASIAVFGFVALNLPRGGVTGWTALDAIMLFLFGVGMAAFLWRYTAIKAVPSSEGLVVRNLFLTREVSWAEILGVLFGEGSPWLILDLADTEQLAVMAVQRADGDFARAEAQRMAALVEAHAFPDESVG